VVEVRPENSAFEARFSYHPMVGFRLGAPVLDDHYADQDFQQLENHFSLS